MSRPLATSVSVISVCIALRMAQIKTYGDLIRRHRNEHAVEWLTSAMKMMQETNDLQQVLQGYLRPETISA